MAGKLEYKWWIAHNKYGSGPTVGLPVSEDFELQCWVYSPRLELVSLWRGNVTPQLQAWARYCAYSLTHRWKCPDDILEYLHTGHVNSDADFFTALRNDGDYWPEMRAAMWAVHIETQGREETIDEIARQVFRCCELASGSNGYLRTHLRSLLLAPLLPESHHPLLSPEHEPVLIDYLLTHRHQVASK